jgi:hypothetical protein
MGRGLPATAGGKVARCRHRLLTRPWLDPCSARIADPAELVTSTSPNFCDFTQHARETRHARGTCPLACDACAHGGVRRVRPVVAARSTTPSERNASHNADDGRRRPTRAYVAGGRTMIATITWASAARWARRCDGGLAIGQLRTLASRRTWFGGVPGYHAIAERGPTSSITATGVLARREHPSPIRSSASPKRPIRARSDSAAFSDSTR